MPDRILKSVLVIMPFGGNDTKKQRRAALQFMRMKYITENLRVDLIRKNFTQDPDQVLCKCFQGKHR